MHHQKNSIKRICLITPGHLSTNPRLIKEAVALLMADYEVHIVFTQYMDYLLGDDDLLLRRYPNLSYDRLKWTSSKQFLRKKTALTQKLVLWLSKVFVGNKLLHKIILNRNYNWQLKKAIQAQADLYIGHNSGSLAVAADAAKKNGVAFGFDAEDFHRGENLSIKEKRSLIVVEDHYLPYAKYLTAASPLISKAYEELYHRKFIVLLNVFPNPQLTTKFSRKNNSLQLFWFSQTIGFDRGIENIIEAISLLADKSPTLHLLGDASQLTKNKFKSLALKFGLKEKNIVFYDPIFPDEIFNLAHKFDIGMATETGIPLNRDICLTNKIFTYIQSGLTVCASDTLAQTDLLNRFPKIGSIYNNNNISSLAKLLKHYQLHPDQLLVAKENCLSLSKTDFNWEKEKLIFLNIIKDMTDD